jgi:2-keto-4-pentenoate hydratase/2-oxohepta-3-ene-1,7-dioic acid hydratase in catechol pathway
MSFRLLRYASPQGPRAAILVDSRVYDLADRLPATAGVDANSVVSLLQHWQTVEPRLRKLASEVDGSGVPLDGLTLESPLVPGNIYCAAANYYDHYREMHGGKERVKEALAPYFFQKSTRGAVGAAATVVKPKRAQHLDWEAEIVAVIGKRARDVQASAALSHVAGYCVGNDLSLRDLLIREDWPVVRTDWLASKSFEGGAPMGPWITPASEVPDPQRLKINTWVNGQVEQDTNSKDMVYSIAEQIESLSSRFALEPGDVIFTGTGGGVGEAKGRFMKAGDVCKITIEALGTIENRIA